MVDTCKEQVSVRAGWIQPEARVQDAGGHVDFVQCNLRLCQEHLRGHQPRDEARERLQHLDAPEEVAAGLRSLSRGRPDRVLEVLSRNLQHEIRIELDEEVIANCRLEGGDVQRQGLVQEVQRCLHVAALAPGQQGLQEGEIRGLAHGDLDLAQELELFFGIVKVSLLHTAMDDAVQGSHVCLIPCHRLVESLLGLRKVTLQHLLVAQLCQVLGQIWVGIGSPLHHGGRDVQDCLVPARQAGKELCTGHCQLVVLRLMLLDGRDEFLQALGSRIAA
mmetsp:Transcript_86450/g.239721  ORF Transcript_86450/g.239721 Transcript_86450/m.239721 type:complete len:276 (-) Transcript_86450:406-1233(-)